MDELLRKKTVSKNSILALGQPLLDIIAHVPEEFLEKYGLKLNNFTLVEEHQRGLYEDLVESYQVKYVPGGCGLNTLRVAQWMLQHSPGATHFVGTIGKDAFGDILQKYCHEDGVHGDFILSELPSGTCAVLVNNGERSLCTRLDASKSSLDDYINSKRFEEALEQAKLIYFAAFMLNIDNGPEAFLRLCKSACEKGKIVTMNLSAPFLIENKKDAILALLPYIDVVFCNEVEADTVRHVLGWEKDADLLKVALHLSSQPKASGVRSRMVVFTQGPDPVLVSVNGKLFEFPVPVLDKVEDTNGAGDSFVGGFLSRYILDESLEDCVRAGMYAARVVIQQSGCSFPPQPDWI